MEYQRIGNKLIIRLDRGDYIMESLQQIVKKEKINTGSVSAIGAIDCADLNFFYYELQNYKTVTFEEEFEVLSLLGNITKRGDDTNLHLHITLGRPDYSTIGGHLKEARVGITLEIFVDIIDTVVDRKPDPEINNINRLSFIK